MGAPQITQPAGSGSDIGQPGAPRVQYIVSSATSPGPDVDLTADIVYITTSGSGGQEFINVPAPPADNLGLGDTAGMGHIVRIATQTLTNASDNPCVLYAGAGEIFANYLMEVLVSAQVTDSNGVQLSFVGATTAFINSFNTMLWYPGLSDFNDNSTFDLSVAENVYGNNGLAAGQAGQGVVITGGNGAPTGNANGSDVTITAGTKSGTGTAGNIILAGLPLSDPHVEGALYLLAGVLTLSAG